MSTTMTLEEAMERVRVILNERGPKRKVVPQTMLRLCPKFEADIRLILAEVERAKRLEKMLLMITDWIEDYKHAGCTDIPASLIKRCRAALTEGKK